MNNHLRIKTQNAKGDGMFSKTGRVTTELHTIFTRKDQILENKLKYLKVSSFPAFDKDLESLALINKIAEKGIAEEDLIPNVRLQTDQTNETDKDLSSDKRFESNLKKKIQARNDDKKSKL